eukprot:COSAG01_NODE_55078_length_327_cov_1.385965_1_plen_48_part_01
MDTPLMEGRLGSLDTQSEAGAGSLGGRGRTGGELLARAQGFFGASWHD